MTREKFYISEENIIFRSYDEEPEECVSPAKGICMLEEYSLDETERIVTVDIEKLRKAGVPEYVIEMIMGCREELSTMRITPSSRILLPEYKIEISMPPLDKALYLLFLGHPEGIRFKELSDHREELTGLYSSITGRGDMDLVRASVDSLTDPMSNSVNEKCSRIKRAFIKALGPELARHYYIDGKSGEPKGIALDRDLVFWD